MKILLWAGAFFEPVVTFRIQRGGYGRTPPPCLPLQYLGEPYAFSYYEKTALPLLLIYLTQINILRLGPDSFRFGRQVAGQIRFVRNYPNGY